MNAPPPMTLVSQARLSQPRGKVLYRVVLTLVVVIFTLVFIGPLYFLFSDGLKSTTEAVQAPPTIIPAHVQLSTYGSAWSRVGLARLRFNTLYDAFGALFFQLIFDVGAPLLAVQAAALRRQAHLRADAGHADDPVHGAARPPAARRGGGPADPAPDPDRLARGYLAAFGGQCVQYLA